MRTGFVLLVASQIILSLLPQAHSADPCNFERVDTLKSWAQLHHFLRRYKCVDDGVMAEAYSAFIVHNLASKWETLRELQSLTKADPSFRKFVVGHIDATADGAELKTVKQNATQRCPSDASNLCREIATEPAKATAQQNAPR